MAPATFDDELRGYLEALERGEQPRAAAEVRIDVDRLRQHLLERLRESAEAWPQWVKIEHDRWSGRLEDLARYIEELDELVTPELEDMQSFACGVLDASIDRLEDDVPLVTRLELERVAGGFGWSRDEVRRYALENDLVHQPTGRLVLTSLGRVFLRLRGKDALRWLLTIEILGSRGGDDPWRISRGLLETALEGTLEFQRYDDGEVAIDDPFQAGIVPWTDGDGTRRFPIEHRTLNRLLSCSILGECTDEALGTAYSYIVPRPMLDVVRSVLDDGPWHAAITALLEDERASVVPTQALGATAATIEQTRMIAHEVRNALGPVRYNVDELLSETLAPEHRTRVDAAKRGVVRVLEFVDQLVATSELITEPPTTFDVESLLQETLGWIDGADGVTLDLPDGPLELRAPRPRLLRALLDVVRNALTSTSPPPPVRLSARRALRKTRITVDDGGPGVPQELRTQIFTDGFTTRPGGSGFGLAFLRQVVERELHGTVTCEESELGGARFTITIPDPEKDP